MTVFEAIILGIVQGLTEFLPISSTAHLRIIPAFLGWSDPGAAFTAVTQIGTMLAVIIYFARDIRLLTGAFVVSLVKLKPFHSPESTMAWRIGFATIPIAVCGFAFHSVIETTFRSLWIMAAMLILVALVLLLAEKISLFRRDISDLTLMDTQLYGWAQALALIPGTSRSGATITAGMLLGFTREAAARFSFLLSIPAVALSGLYQLYAVRHSLAGSFGISLLAGTVVAGIVGYLSIEFLLKYLRMHRMHLFIAYRLLLGLALLVGLAAEYIQP